MTRRHKSIKIQPGGKNSKSFQSPNYFFKGILLIVDLQTVACEAAATEKNRQQEKKQFFVPPH